jgi:phage repressor protein C with HTH and peptisase S24 domain
VYLIRVTGDSMEAEIQHRSLIVGNRNLSLNAGDFVLAEARLPY